MTILAAKKTWFRPYHSLVDGLARSFSTSLLTPTSQPISRVWWGRIVRIVGLWSCLEKLLVLTARKIWLTINAKSLNSRRAYRTLKWKDIDKEFYLNLQKALGSWFRKCAHIGAYLLRLGSARVHVRWSNRDNSCLSLPHINHPHCRDVPIFSGGGIEDLSRIVQFL